MSSSTDDQDPASTLADQEVSPSPAAVQASSSVDRKRALERLMELLSISAVSGEEKPVQEYLIKALSAMGVPRGAIRVDDAPERIQAPCQTGNLIVTLSGNVSGARRLFSAHMDTVPLARDAEPVINGGRIVSMGQTALGGDDRAGVAVLLNTLSEIQRLDLPHPPLTFLFTVREESGLRGAAAVRPEDLGGAQLSFNFDGGRPEDLTIGSVGADRMKIVVKGLAAHAGVHPEQGVSAVAIFAAATNRLEQAGWLGLIEKPEGKGTSNIGVVNGGEATNVLTDRLVARAEARSHDEKFLEQIVAEYRKAFEESAREHKNNSGTHGGVEIDVEKHYFSYALAENATVVQTALSATRAIGLSPVTRISNGGLDASWITRHGIPSLSLGCGQHEIHTTAECVEIEEFLNASRLALVLAIG